jgi:hypothetical protein
MSWPGPRQLDFLLHFDRPGCSGPDNSAIRIVGIEDSSGQDRRPAPQGGDCIFFFGVLYFVSNLGGIIVAGPETARPRGPGSSFRSGR